MKRLVLFMHTTLDGFVGGPNGEMDWIHVGDEMFEYASMQISNADIALYGRVTYQMMESYWPTAADQPNATKHDIEHSAWYNSVQKVVVSKTIKGTDLVHTKVIDDHLATEIRKLKDGTGKNIVMFGSPSIARFLMEENLIDDYWLFVNPILLGNGIPLFKHFDNSIKLKLIASEVFASGVVCLHYEAKTNG